MSLDGGVAVAVTVTATLTATIAVTVTVTVPLLSFPPRDVRDAHTSEHTPTPDEVSSVSYTHLTLPTNREV